MGHKIEADFSGAILKEVNLMHCILRGVKFGTTDLTDAFFRFADIRDSFFTNADLMRADFRNANFSRNDFTGADVNGAKFEDKNIAEKDLRKHFSKILRGAINIDKIVIYNSKNNKIK